MDKIISLSLTERHIPQRFDWVQNATKPNIIFVLEDYLPGNGATAVLYMQKPSGAVVYNNCTILDNRITYIPTAQSFAEVGENHCELQIIESSGTALSFLILATVAPNIIDSAKVRSTDEFGELTTLIRNATQYENVIGGNNFVGANNRQYWNRIPDGTDLNTITDVGIYNAPSNAVAGTLTNCPTSYAFKMMVDYTYGTSFGIRQTIFIYHPNHQGYVYARSTQDSISNWGPWIKSPTRGEIDTMAEQVAPLNQRLTVVQTNNILGANNGKDWISINEYTDLNTLKTPGIYYTTSAAITGTLVNSPIDEHLLAQIKLVVEQTGPVANRVKQTITMPPVISTASIPFVERSWVRQTYDGSVWEPWVSVPTRAELDTLINAGAKNLLPSNTSYNSSGITASTNADGSINYRSTGQNSEEKAFQIGRLYLNPGKYTLAGGLSDKRASLQVYNYTTNTVLGYDRGNAFAFTIAERSDIAVRVYVPANTSESAIFYPLLRYSSVINQDYVPYGKTNAALTSDVKRINSDISTITTTLTRVRLPITRIANDHFDQESIDLLYAYEVAGVLWLNGNFRNTAEIPGGTSDFTPMAQIEGWSAATNTQINIPAQSRDDLVLTIQISRTGVISYYNGKTARAIPAGTWARSPITAVK